MFVINNVLSMITTIVLVEALRITFFEEIIRLSPALLNVEYAF
ncbi:hypothetical protein KNP414_01836 [Paenibacillus mucilaginosus KNP414]|uniref:Uncharacterized protein n=1 Tax=Paenibacillus mucilaginosus (strain KNP414) TaxID=1036673 RepID=F8FQP3_PAEMK|nr:hypothetical protein KNP414_01836 [Paenibacillus mucilaginosus KNP414]